MIAQQVSGVPVREEKSRDLPIMRKEILHRSPVFAFSTYERTNCYQLNKTNQQLLPLQAFGVCFLAFRKGSNHG